MSSASRPVTELDKSDVLAGLFGTWESLDQLLTGLSEQQWQTPTPLPGWCVHDVLAHIIGTESVLQGLGAPDADTDVSALHHVRNDVASPTNAGFVTSALNPAPSFWSGSARSPPIGANP